MAAWVTSLLHCTYRNWVGICPMSIKDILVGSWWDGIMGTDHIPFPSPSENWTHEFPFVKLYKSELSHQSNPIVVSISVESLTIFLLNIVTILSNFADCPMLVLLVICLGIWFDWEWRRGSRNDGGGIPTAWFCWSLSWKYGSQNSWSCNWRGLTAWPERRAVVERANYHERS